MPYFHFTARTLGGLTPLQQRDRCADLWARLRKVVEQTLGCVLMPNHLHLLAETAEPEKMKFALGHELGGFARKYFPGQKVWSSVPYPTPIPDLHHLKRQIRYVHLNPCRRGLVNDPLLWEWSTHREAVGAAASGWLNKKTLIHAFKMTPRLFIPVFHQYVSADPSVRVTGTPVPPVFAPDQLIAPGKAVLEAVLHASRGLPDTPSTRRQVVLLGQEMKLLKRSFLEETTGLSPRQIRKIVSRPPHEEDPAVLKAAVLMLSAPERFGISR